MSYPEIQAMTGVLPFGLRHYWKGHFVRDLEPSAIEAVVGAMGDTPGGYSFLLIEAIGGQARIEPAVARRSVSGRRAGTSAPSGIWEDPSHDAAQIAWVRRTADALRPASLTGAGTATTRRWTRPTSGSARASAPSGTRACVT